jgi:hypothetical protein
MPKSLFNRMLLGVFFGVEGDGGEIYTEFSTAVVSGDRAVV